jgi:hypothetical protein
VKRNILIRVVVGIVVAVLVIQNWIQSGQISFGPSKIFSTAALAATVVLALWDIWLWRLPVFRMVPGTPRCVRGTWKGVLTSFWVDPATGKSPAPKHVYLVVRQTATLVSVRLLTNESRSSSSLAAVTTVDGTSELTYLYLNRPDAGVEHRSRMHHGSTALDISGSPAKRLKGRYWTDRDSRGELDFTEWSKQLADDFDEAASLFS